MKLKIFYITVAAILVPSTIIILYLTTWPWIAIYLGLSNLPDPPKPEITYKEFPFRLVYTFNEKTEVISDILICEYDGIGLDEGNGKYNKWKGYLSDKNDKIILFTANSGIGVARKDKEIKNQIIFFDPGPAGFYMGDVQASKGYKSNFPNASFSEEYLDGSSAKGVIFSDDLFKKYNIKLVDWKIKDPIQNTFK